MKSEENIALFDRYLMSEMDEVEKTAFEERLAHSASLKNEFEAYQSFGQTISEGAEYTAITDTLKDIHADIYPKKKSKLLSPKFLIPIGIAASIALLLFFNPFGKDEMTAANENYAPLANDDYGDYAIEEAAEATEAADEVNGNSEEGYLDSEEMTQGFETLNDSLPLIQYTPRGTAFLISQDGYFLTSKHLVEGKGVIDIQHKELRYTFGTEVVYIDTLLDLAILKCSDDMAQNFAAVPYVFVNETPELGDDVFTLGYSKKDIVYAKGVVSSETGYQSDSIYQEISLPSNAGFSGAPLFNMEGKLVGIITARRSDKQAVTYSLKHNYISDCIENLSDSISIDMTGNYSKSYTRTRAYTRLYRNFIFEVH